MRSVKLQRRLASSILKAGKDRVQFKPTSISEVREAITRADIRKLIKKHIISKVEVKGTSSVRARAFHIQRKKGRRRGIGSRKGSKGARSNPKRLWVNRIRLQRQFLRELKDKHLIVSETFKQLYGLSKGGFFRSKAHLKLYVNDNKLIRSK